MNIVQIKCTYFSSKIDVLLNSEPLSPYSELSTIIKRPFIESAPQIIKGLDAEIFDDYKIECQMSEFQYEVIRTESLNSEFCKAVEYVISPASLSPQQLYQELIEIGQSNGLRLDERKEVTVYSSSPDYYVPKDGGYNCVPEPVADVGIFSMAESDSSCKTKVLIVDNEIGIKRIDNRNYFTIPKEKLPLFWAYYDEVERTVPHIEDYCAALKYKRLDEPDNTHLSSLMSGEPAYYVGSIPSSIDKGQSETVIFNSFPQNAFYIESSDAETLSVSSNTITGIAEGEAEIRIKNLNGDTIEKYVVQIIGHVYVTSIRMLPRFKFLKVNERNHIDVHTFPENAEDENQLIWESSDNGVLQIDSKGDIIALKTGIAYISVHSREANASIPIEVKPALTSLRIVQPSIRLKPGQTTILDTEIIPENAQAENLRWEIDNKTIATINKSKNGRRCQVTALTGYEGKGNIRCIDPDANLSAICNIEVVRKVKPNIFGKLALWCLILGMIMPLLLPVSTGASIIGLVKDKDPEHKTRYIVCAIGSVLVLLFWIIITRS